MLVQSTSYLCKETWCLLNLVHVALMFRFRGSKVCGVENLPPLCTAQPVMAGVWLFTRFSSLQAEVRKRARFP